ncbi:phosphatidylserine synthase I (serine-exchange enzyme I) [Cryptosporidium bovis]|uniref:phosphatidylserine synthase I (serine-exchange enzyme I) n=1 Tax=Cryptosporidium bovis TaxID=310047 RepID=UPI003519DBE6|nr:phosphatidylserine synthase I (serine-exchange enzyme I) [Cryptosporidium bovis]
MAIPMKYLDETPNLYISKRSCLYISVFVLLVFLASELLYKNNDFYFFGMALNNYNSRITLGLISSILTYSIVSIYIFPKGTYNWPSYGFWKVIFGLIVLYFHLLVFLLFQDMEDIKRVLEYIDPSLKGSTFEINYAYGNSCSLMDNSNGILSNVRSKIDTFVIAHFVGWGIKTLILRDNFLIWFNSIFFEWLEITFRHLLPNFHECWWDHLLLDIFGCNLLGIVMGNILIKQFNLITYSWHTNRPYCENDSGNNNIISFKWPSILSTLRGYFSFIILTIVVQLIDLNYFFFKAEFSMPVSHWIFIIRTPLLAICGSSATRELYETLSTGSSLYYGKIHFQYLILTMVILSETLLCWRFRHSLNAKTLLPPMFVSIVWLILLSILVIIFVSLFIKRIIHEKKKIMKEN